MTESAELPVRVAVLESQRVEDRERQDKLEAAVDQIKMVGWIISGAVVLQTILQVWHK